MSAAGDEAAMCWRSPRRRAFPLCLKTAMLRFMH